MPRKAIIRSDGSIPLDTFDDLGFKPGKVVEIIRTSRGSLIVVLDDSVSYDVPFKALVGGAAQHALRKQRQRTA